MEQKRPLFRRFERLKAKIRNYLAIARADSIARRYFILNSFDGAITVFSIVLASLATGVSNPRFIIVTALSACIAMATSGFFGAYMAEKSEHGLHLKNLEEKHGGELPQIHYDAAAFSIYYLAFVDSVAPTLASLPLITPIIAAVLGLISMPLAYAMSLAMALATLFVLGVYIGKSSKGNNLSYGLMMLAVGLIAALLIFLVHFLVGV